MGKILKKTIVFNEMQPKKLIEKKEAARTRIQLEWTYKKMPYFNLHNYSFFCYSRKEDASGKPLFILSYALAIQ